MSISLVIGTYNPNKEWFDTALQSADGLFDELLVVDDGSDIPVENAVAHVSNKGFYEARNTGCLLAQGQWIASLDDDDEFIRDNVEELKEFLKTTDADIVSFPIELFGNQSGMSCQHPDMNDILNNNQVPSGSWFKKEVWKELKGFQIDTAEDWDFWARAWKKQKKFAHFPKPVYRHRMVQGSLSSSWTGEKFYEIRDQIRTNYEKN